MTLVKGKQNSKDGPCDIAHQSITGWNPNSPNTLPVPLISNVQQNLQIKRTHQPIKTHPKTILRLKRIKDRIQLPKIHSSLGNKSTIKPKQFSFQQQRKIDLARSSDTSLISCLQKAIRKASMQKSRQGFSSYLKTIQTQLQKSNSKFKKIRIMSKQRSGLKKYQSDLMTINKSAIISRHKEY